MEYSKFYSQYLAGLHILQDLSAKESSTVDQNLTRVNGGNETNLFASQTRK